MPHDIKRSAYARLQLVQAGTALATLPQHVRKLRGGVPKLRDAQAQPGLLDPLDLEVQPLIEDQSVQVGGADDAILLSDVLQPPASAAMFSDPSSQFWLSRATGLTRRTEYTLGSPEKTDQ